MKSKMKVKKDVFKPKVLAENEDKYLHIKKDLLKSLALSLLAIGVIVVVYWF